MSDQQFNFPAEDGDYEYKYSATEGDWFPVSLRFGHFIIKDGTEYHGEIVPIRRGDMWRKPQPSQHNESE